MRLFIFLYLLDNFDVKHIDIGWAENTYKEAPEKLPEAYSRCMHLNIYLLSTLNSSYCTFLIMKQNVLAIQLSRVAPAMSGNRMVAKEKLR